MSRVTKAERVRRKLAAKAAVAEQASRIDSSYTRREARHTGLDPTRFTGYHWVNPRTHEDAPEKPSWPSRR